MPPSPTRPPPSPASVSLPSPTLPPTIRDLGWVAAITAAKAAVIALAVDAFANSGSPRFSGKAMRVRAVGYAGGLLAVPLAWRIRGRASPSPRVAPYPRALDLLVTLPLLADAAGNAAGIYQRAHVDDAIHFANGALFTGVAGALITARTRTAVEAAGYAAATGVAAGAAWEILEWVGLKAGARGMHLSYDDTMADLIETSAGALLGGLVTLLRHPGHLRHVPGRPQDPLVRRRG